MFSATCKRCGKSNATSLVYCSAQCQLDEIMSLKPTGYTVGLWGHPVATFTPLPKEQSDD